MSQISFEERCTSICRSNIKRATNGIRFWTIVAHTVIKHLHVTWNINTSRRGPLRPPSRKKKLPPGAPSRKKNPAAAQAVLEARPLRGGSTLPTAQKDKEILLRHPAQQAPVEKTTLLVTFPSRRLAEVHRSIRTWQRQTAQSDEPQHTTAQSDGPKDANTAPKKNGTPTRAIFPYSRHFI